MYISEDTLVMHGITSHIQYSLVEAQYTINLLRRRTTFILTTAE